MTTQVADLKARLKPLSPFHFVGMGGSGMAPLASLVRSAGIEISGSDLSTKVQTFKELSGVPFEHGHETCELLNHATTLVLSSAVPDDNPEVVRAKALGKRILHRSDLIALISESFKTITVSGTHGKSTTSALISYLLLKLNLEPSFILGAKLLGDIGSSARLGSGEYLVLEADESDGTFQKYRPFVAVVTNIDQDHMDFYGSMPVMEEAFYQHLQNVDPEGFAVLFWDHERVRALADRKLSGTRLTYGSFLGSEIRLLSQKQFGTKLSFEAIVEHQRVDVQLPLVGKHNAFNALAALSVVHALGFSVSRAAKALFEFPGVSRRLSVLFEDERRVIYDDYAYNPVKISSCLSGVRSAFPKSQITAVFQAHRFSRLRHMYVDMLSAFKDVDRVLVVPVFSAGEPLDERFDVTSLSGDIHRYSNVAAIGLESLKDARELLQLDDPTQHTVYVTVGAGDVSTVAKEFAQYLQSRRP